MGVTREDVRRMAALARIGVPEGRLDALARELDGILAHMEALRGNAELGTARTERGIVCAPDVVGPIPLAQAIDAFAPATRDGFFVVPRLGTHDRPADAEDRP